MEEVIGLVVDALTKRARAAQPPRPAPSRRATPQTPAIRVLLPASGAPAPAAPPAPAPARPAATASRPVAPVVPPAPAPPAGLLSAFSSRERLLAAIVLSEALAPPVALRENPFPPSSVLGPQMRRIDAG